MASFFNDVIGGSDFTQKIFLILNKNTGIDVIDVTNSIMMSDCLDLNF